ncbi:MAG TPA: VWA domain-containing protein [Flavisolibacter sp.]
MRTMNFQYQYPEAFWLLILVPLLLLLYSAYLLWRKRTAKRIGDERLVAALTKSHSNFKAQIKFVLFLFAFTLGCLALANPRKPDDASAEIRKGIDVVIALDVSNSMLATDVSPNRLTQAQKLLTSLIDKMPNDRVGFVVFAGNAYTQMPLSTDHEAAKLFISTANPGTVPEQGTSVADALLQSNAAFEEGSQRFKTIILVTDGETHDEDAVTTAQDLAKKGVMINTVGLGSVAGATIMDTTTGTPKKDDEGNVVVSKLNEGLLQQISAATNGAYIQLNAVAPAMTTLLDQYKNVEKKALVDTSGLTYESFYWWLLLPMLLFLLFELFLPDRKKVTV